MISRRDSFLAGLILVGFCGALAVAEPMTNNEMGDTVATICQHGYSAAHRMPYSKSAIIKHEMLNGRDARDYELDHIIPLCLGGTNDLSNLQLQPWPEARVKDELERKACKMVCTGTLRLDEARSWFKRSH